MFICWCEVVVISEYLFFSNLVSLMWNIVLMCWMVVKLFGYLLFVLNCKIIMREMILDFFMYFLKWFDSIEYNE